MLHKPFGTALRNLSRDGFYTGIMVLGLAVGFAAAMLIGLYAHNEYSFERFISGYEQVYRLETDTPGPGGEPQRTGFSVSTAAAQIALDVREVEQVVRLALSSRWVGKDEAKTWERVAWVDPDFFNVLPFPVLAGDAVAAMHEPNSVILTRAMARKHFGQDAPLGETLLVQHVSGDPEVYPMVVRAVLKDPGDTHLEQFGIFAAGLAAWSPLTELDQNPVPFPLVFTYVRLRSGVLADDVRADLPGFAEKHYPPDLTFRLEAIEDLHLTADVRAVNAGIAAVGVLIIVVAAIDVGFFEMHGLRPLAGRFFSEDRGEDMVLDRADPDPEAQPTVVLNESGVRLLGFESPEAAVGKSLDWLRPFAAPPGSSPPLLDSRVVGVVPDFTLIGTLRDTIEPTMYYVDPPSTELLLEGFASRVSLPFWSFLAASTSALLIAWATIATQAWLAAHAEPATAVRHE